MVRCLPSHEFQHGDGANPPEQLLSCIVEGGILLMATRNPAFTSWGKGGQSHYLQGFIRPRWWFLNHQQYDNTPPKVKGVTFKKTAGYFPDFMVLWKKSPHNWGLFFSSPYIRTYNLYTLDNQEALFSPLLIGALEMVGVIPKACPDSQIQHPPTHTWRMGSQDGRIRGSQPWWS